MKTFTFLILASLALGTVTQTAPAAEKDSAAAQAKRIVREMFAESVPGILSRQTYPGGTQVAFRYNKMRYTVCTPNGGSCLTFYVRPDGSTGGDSVEIFTDRGPDGAVNTGAGPKGTDKHFDNTIGSPNLTIGREHEAHWQARYETALADACAFLDSHKSNG